MKLTKAQAGDVLHKMEILASEPDLLESYGLTEEQGQALLDSVPCDSVGGEWVIPDWAAEAVAGELEDMANLWRDIADDLKKGFALTKEGEDQRRREIRELEREARALERMVK